MALVFNVVDCHEFSKSNFVVTSVVSNTSESWVKALWLFFTNF